MTRLCLALTLVASACFMALAMDTTTTTGGSSSSSSSSSTTSQSSSTTTSGFRPLVTRRVERQAQNDDDSDDSDESLPARIPNDDGQGPPQPQQQPPHFQPRPFRQAPRGSSGPVTQEPVPPQMAEETTRKQRQAATTDFADDQQQNQGQAGQPGLEGRHNTQFNGPRRPNPGPAPRPGQRPGPGPSRPQPQPQPGPGSATLTLPDGVDLIIGAVQPGFSCDDKIYGYYADTFNDCRLFHVCVPNVDPNGITHNLQWSFVCGNTTRFNQELLICDHEDNVDCSQAQNFYNVNENFGRPEDKTGRPAPGGRF